MEEYLTKEERQAYFSELTDVQIDILNKFKKHKLSSEFLTELNQDGVYWKVVGEDVYEEYDQKHPNDSPLTCSCGRHVKYQYHCESSKGEKKDFGGAHLAEEAGIPLKVVNQVNKINHTIDRGIDLVLSAYHDGKRFPKELYKKLYKYRLTDEFTNNELEFLKAFQEANLPIYSSDYKKLKECCDDYEYQVYLHNREIQREKERKAQKERERIRQKQEQQRLERVHKAQEQIYLQLKTEREAYFEEQEARMQYACRTIDDPYEYIQGVTKFADNFLQTYNVNLENYGITNSNLFFWKYVIYFMFNEGRCKSGDFINIVGTVQKLILKVLDKQEWLYPSVFGNRPRYMLQPFFRNYTNIVFRAFIDMKIITKDYFGFYIFNGKK